MNQITIDLLNCLSFFLGEHTYNVAKYNKCICVVFLIVINIMKMVDILSEAFQNIYICTGKLFKANF